MNSIVFYWESFPAGIFFQFYIKKINSKQKEYFFQQRKGIFFWTNKINILNSSVCVIYDVLFCLVLRALHEKEERTKGGLTRSQFFVIAFLCSFAYYVFPGYIFQMLTSLSWICWIFPNNVLAQQLGSGLSGLGIGAIGFDWSAISAYLGIPLASPWFATANVAVGFMFVMYVVTPLSYWFNAYDAKTFPIFSSKLFTSTGQIYNITDIIDSNFHLDLAAYDRQGRLHISTFFAMTYGVGFAALTATIMHVALFHGR